MAHIYCVDDDPAILALLEPVLVSIGHEVTVARSVTEALAGIERSHVDLILCDSRMPRLSGIDLIRSLNEAGRRIPVIIITGHSSIEDAVQSMRIGAIDYLTKPIRREALELTIQHALDFARLRNENEVFRQELSRLSSQRKIIGRSQVIRDLREQIETVAPTRASVLLQGESGTGKELVARAIHEQSPRRDKPFITVNSAALPEGLVESVLFGHEKGAFTGATTRAAGAFERADGGTLLLDEISEMRLDLQAKLLRAIQEQEFERVGGRESIRVDVRLIATTNRDLLAEVEAGRFRADLYYRLHVVPIRTPPLRERPDDIPFLVQQFITTAGEQLGVKVGELPAETLTALQRYSWPGNVRELANAVERAAIMSRGQPLTMDFFEPYLQRTSVPPAGQAAAPSAGRPTAPVEGAAPDGLPLNLNELERIAIERALVATGQNRTRAARLLGISERTLRNKLNIPVSP